MSGTESLFRAAAVSALVSLATTAAKADVGDSAGPAQGPPADAAAAAQALFVEGKHLVSEGHYAEGCAKLERSQRLDPAAGTQINLADCYEKSGKLARAWMTFHEAVAAADRAHRPDWADQARQRARILEPGVPQLTVVVDGPASGFELLRDGAHVETSTYGMPVPVDPGVYEITATAPGYRPWATRLPVEKGAHVVLHVPALAEDLSSAAANRDAHAALPPAVAAGADRSRQVQRTVALAVGGAAVVLLGVGTYAGLTAVADNRNAAALCPASPRCTDPYAVALTDDARHAASVSTVAFIGGGALLAASAGLFLAVPSARRAGSFSIGVAGRDLVLAGRW